MPAAKGAFHAGGAVAGDLVQCVGLCDQLFNVGTAPVYQFTGSPSCVRPLVSSAARNHTTDECNHGTNYLKLRPPVKAALCNYGTKPRRGVCNYGTNCDRVVCNYGTNSLHLVCNYGTNPSKLRPPVELPPCCGCGSSARLAPAQPGPARPS